MMDGKPMKKSQAAMEYLITYGWAILIIVGIAAGLFALGVFSNNASSKGAPGACSIYRPFGGGSTNLATLQGACNSAEPQYVGVFSGSNSFLQGSWGKTFPYGSNALSVFAWVWTNSTSKEVVFSYGNEVVTGGILSLGVGETGASGGVSTGNPTIDFYSVSADSGVNVENGKWHFIGFVILKNSAVGNFVVDGTTYPVTLAQNPAISTTGNFQIGRWINYPPAGADFNARAFTGYIADVQLYNSALSSNTVFALYKEGVGGAPVNLINLVGWWPLNGNGNDYGGNGYNTTFSNITYSTAWTQGYTIP